MGPPYGKRDPYHSHIFRDSYGSGMGIVWEAYHKGVPSLGVPENPTDSWLHSVKLTAKDPEKLAIPKGDVIFQP